MSPVERRRRLEELLRYVATLGLEHQSLVFDCSRLLYAESRELALRLFLDARPAETPLPLDAVLRQLRLLAQEDPQLALPWEKNALEITFLRNLVWNKKSEIPAVHTRLALLYAMSVQQLAEAESRGEPVAELRQRSTAELREFLELSDSYDMQVVLDALDDALVEERAVEIGSFSDIDRAVENGSVFGGTDPNCPQNGRRRQSGGLLSSHFRPGQKSRHFPPTGRNVSLASRRLYTLPAGKSPAGVTRVCEPHGVNVPDFCHVARWTPWVCWGFFLTTCRSMT